MCIRDSPRPGPEDRAPGRADRRRGRAARARPEGRSPARTACLLYTSEAADERSRVDLGGRRIIKKKQSGDHSAHDVY